jgi:enoyl-CoA hydratase/carnithine racemase
VDLISAVDIRVCSSDAEFAVKETQVAIVADLGTLQRLERIVSKSLARQMVQNSTHKSDFDCIFLS